MKACELIRGKLAEYAVGGLRRRARARVEAHVGECERCRAELAALKRTGALLDEVGADDAPAGTWEAVRQRMTEHPRAGVRARPRWAWAMGGVALVLVALAVLLIGPPRVEEPVLVAAAEADEEMQATMDGHLSAVWAAPLSDVAGVGLRMAALENDG
ncbi:MAG: zf-HC2 domain-containing protein [Armatimonadota bacterium]|nr:MAG: zf-HC2 domain-containing protein [Armatimonadota bacterium]